MPSCFTSPRSRRALLLGAQRPRSRRRGERRVERLRVLADVVVRAGDGREREVARAAGSCCRRSSTGSMPSSTAAMSMMRSSMLVGLGTARAAVRARRRGVGDDAAHVELDLRDAVHALRHRAGEERQERADRRVRRRRRRVRCRADRRSCRRASGPARRAAPGRARAPSRPCSPSGSRSTSPAGRASARPSPTIEVLDVDAGLRAEPAADGRRDHAHRRGVEPERRGERVAARRTAPGSGPTR